MRKKIALITGGYTGETEISLKSAKNVYHKIDKEKYEVYTINVTKDLWYYKNEYDEIYHVDLNDFSINLTQQKIVFDVAFIVMHGSPGEDGKLQGYLDMLNIPYTSCNHLSSAITMNKAYTKQIVSNIPSLNLAKSVQLTKADEAAQFKKVEEALQLPLIVKTNSGGSSIGISKIEAYAELPSALQKAFLECDEVIIEELIVGREFSVGVFKDNNGKITVLPATEVVIESSLFDFETKYFNNKLKEVTPARLTSVETEQMKSIVKEIYQRLNCFGIVRIDFFIETYTDKFFFLEVNTIPGQTDHSFVPKQIRAAGLDITEIYTSQIEQAIYRKYAMNSVST